MGGDSFCIYFNTVGRSYEGELSDNFDKKGCSVVKFTNGETNDILTEFENKSGTKACLMVHVSNSAGVSAAVKLLSASKNMEGKSIVLMSTFQTWAGKRYGAPILDVEKNFCCRVASQAASDAFLLENAFYNASKLSHKGCVLGIGLVYGEGGFDFESAFKSLWYDCDTNAKRDREKAEAEAIEEGEPLPGPSTSSLTTTILSDSNGANRVPMVHIEDLATQLFHLADAFAQAPTNGTGSVCASPAASPEVYFAASDVPAAPPLQPGADSLSSSAATWTLAGLFHQISEKLDRTVKFTSQSEVMEMYFNSDDSDNATGENAMLCSGKFDWLQDISFVSALAPTDGAPSVSFAPGLTGTSADQARDKPNSAKPGVPPVALENMSTCAPALKYPNGLCLNFSKVWDQFLSAHRLVPCVVLVTGSSQVQGKAVVVEEVCRHMGLAVLDPIACTLDVVANQAVSKGNSSADGSIAGIGSALRGRITGHLEAAARADQEAAAAEPVKGKGKGKAADAAPVGTEKIEITTITEETAKSLPNELVHQCIAFKVYSGIKSGTYKGCVLDINWDTTTLFTSSRDFVDIFTCKNLITLPSVPAGRRGAGGDSGSRMGTGRANTGSQAAHHATVAAASKNILEMEQAMVWPDLVVEVQCDSTAIMRKQMLTWGVALDLPINKLSKDQQASHAALESALLNYKGSLREIGSPPVEESDKPANSIDENGGVSPRRDKEKDKEKDKDADPNSVANKPFKTLTHPVVLELEHLAQKLVPVPSGVTWAPNVYRPNMTPVYTANGNNVPLSAEEMKVLVTELVDLFMTPKIHGNVGWYSLPLEVVVGEPGPAAEDEKATATAAAAPTTAAADSKKSAVSPRAPDSKAVVADAKAAPESKPDMKSPTELLRSPPGESSRSGSTPRGRSGSKSRSSSLTDSTKPQTPLEHSLLTRPTSTAGSKGRGKDGVVNPEAVFEFDLQRIGESFPENTDASGGNKVQADNLANMDDLSAAVLAVSNPAEKDALVGKSGEIQSYLVANVLTHAAECLIVIARTRPEDPIRFFHDFLLERGQQIQSASEASAFQNFINPLSADEVTAFYASRGEEVPEDVLERARRNDELERAAEEAALESGPSGSMSQDGSSRANTEMDIVIEPSRSEAPEEGAPTELAA